MFEKRSVLIGGLGLIAVLSIGVRFFSSTPKNDLVEAEPVYDYSLKIKDEKIKGYRNPAAQKKYQVTATDSRPNQQTQSYQGKTKSNKRVPIIEASPAIMNSTPNYSGSRLNNSTSPVSPHRTQNSGDQQTSNEAQGNVSSNGTLQYSNTPYPGSTTGVVPPSEEDKSDSTPPPEIPFLKGKVKPLDGIISKYNTNFLINSAYANVCTNPRILLMDLANFSILLDNPITAAEIQSSTAFEFDPIELQLDIKNPQRYMLQTLGCEINFQRIITSFYEMQDLDKITTLVSKVINTKIAGVLNNVSSISIDKLYAQVQKKSSPTIEFEEVYKIIEDEGSLKDHFKQTFSGVPPVELTVAAPDVNEITIHSALKEKTSYKFEAKTFHWNLNYRTGYEWRVDGEIKSTTAIWDYTPGANSKREQVITLVIGQKNTNNEEINRSTPYHEINFDVTVSDDYPPVAPVMALNPFYTNPGNTRSLKFDLDTGTESEGTFKNCETFDSLALKESSEQPQISDFIFDCNAGPVQTISYNIQNPLDGPVTLYLWAMDSAGKISQLPSVVNLAIDTSKPIIDFLNLNAAYEADAPAVFKWALSEMNAKATQNFKLEFYNGGSWQNLPDVPLTDGPHMVTPFEMTYQIPNILTANAKIRISYADIFGQETIKESESFAILKPLLSSTPTHLDMGEVQNKQDSSEYTLIFTNSGAVSSKVCSAPVLTGPQATEFSIVRDECQGKTIGASGCEVGIKAHPLTVGIKTANISIACQNDGHAASVKIESKNNSPIVANLSLATAEDTALIIELGPIQDEDGDNLSYHITTPPAYGTLNSCGVSADKYRCTYTPDANFNGPDVFNFKSGDGNAYSNIGSASINVTPVNDAPSIAATQAVSTNEDTVLNFTLNAGSDIENTPLNYIIVNPPGSGTLSCVGGTNTSCSYTPALDFNGITTFTYKVNDGELDSTIATVTITVNPVNDPPVMGMDQTLSATEDTNFSFTLNNATDIDLPAQTLSYKLVSLPTKGTLTACLNETTYLTDRTCTFVPHANANGVDSFTFIANDGVTDAVSVTTVTLNITPVNDAPTVTPTQSVSTAEDTPVTFELNAGADIEGSPLNYIIVSPPAQGTLSCVGGLSQTCTYTPPLNFDSSTSFTYKVNDGALDSNTALVTINVTSENDAPVMGANQNFSTNEDTALNLTLNAASDVDLPAQTITYKLITAPAKGTLSGCINGTTYTTGRNCVYTPSLNANGTDTFTFRANDGLTDADTVQTVTITINPVNDAPTLAATQSVSTNEDTPLAFNLNAGSDIEGDTLSYVKLSNPASGTLTCTGGSSRACNYTPAANFNGSVSFTYKVNDGLADSNTATVTITVNPVNDPPVMAANQTFSVNDNTNLTINLSPATDIDGGVLTYKIITPPANGTLSDCITTVAYGSDLSCTYKSNVNFNGTDSFTFIAYDTFANALTPATVTITVSDKTPPSAPLLITRTSPEYTKVTAATFTAGTCADQSMLLVNAGGQPAAGAAGWQTCTTTANAITGTLTTTQGAQTLYVWAKDAYGNVSTTSTNFVIYYDTVLPTMALTTPPIQKGGAAYNFAWTATESYTTTSLNFTIDFFNGSTWSNVGTTPSTTGPLSNTAFTRAWSVPAINTAAAKFRVSFTDRAGNTQTVTSGSFTIDSLAPGLTITSPADNSYHKSSATITGACETGRDIEFSGGIQTTFTIACSGGTYSQLINFSNGDGTKNVTVKQVDVAGNITSISRNLIRDEIPPVMAKTTGNSPDFTRFNQPNAWSGTCEGNFTINVSGAQTTSFACTSGTWSWTPTAKTVDGTYNYNLVQTDAAGNVSTPPLTLSWTRDATAPTLTTTTPVAASAPPNTTKTFTNNLSVLNFNGTCEGTNPIKITLAPSTTMATMSCSSSTWSWTTPAASADGNRTYIVEQTDPAGNISKITYSWTRDTTGPGLKIDNPSIKNNINTAVFTGDCENGLPVEITGAQTTSVTCSSGAWTFTTASKTVDGTYNYTFKQTRTVTPFNSTTVTGSWIRKTTAPTISSFTTTAANPSRSSYIPISLDANSNHANVLLTHVCIKSDDSTKPAAGDSCFIAINSPVIGLALSNVLDLNGHYILMGWTPKAYLIYPWVLDEAGNISNLTAAGAGTINTDKLNHTYDPGIPPSVWDVIAANIGNSPLPPTRLQGEVPAGTDVYIRWKTTDNNPLPAGAVSLSYTTDEINFNGIASGINAYNNNCGVTLAANEGCYKWTGGSPLNSSYKVRVRVTDTTDISTQLISNPTNMGPIKILAGNTESGLNGSAQTAMFYTRRNGYSDPGTLVVTEDGKFYFADYKRGILTIDQADGKQKIFIPATGASTGDGGAAVNATLNYPVKITMDYQNRLLIMDVNRIRRVDLNLSTPTIETIIGGGTDNGDIVNNPLNVSIYSHSTGGGWNHSSQAFFATPNGDIYFHSEYATKDYNKPSYRLRIYKEATGQVISKYFTGIGDEFVPSQDLSKCRMSQPVISFNPNNSQLTGVSLATYRHLNYPGCDQLNDKYSRAYFDPETFEAITPKDGSYAIYYDLPVTGMNGNSYIIRHRSAVYQTFNGIYSKVLGQGTIGECEDGTDALSCMIDIQNFYVTTTGKIYFTDRGVIRTIDENGKIKTLFGQRLTYGNNVNALNARFSEIHKVFRLDNGKIIANDVGGSYLKEFTIEGNINIVAGDGAIKAQNHIDPASSQSVINTTWSAVNKTNGDIFSSTVNDQHGNYAKLNRATGKWEQVIGSSGGTHYISADGVPGINIQSNNSNINRGLILGFGNNDIVISRMKHYPDINRYEDFMIKLYKTTDFYRQSHLAGVEGYPADNNIRRTCDATTAVSAATCEMPYWDTFFHFQWDSENSRWITATVQNDSIQRNIYEFKGGILKRIGYTASNIDDSFVYVKLDGIENFYYCNSGRIKRYNLTTQQDLGEMPWSMSNLSCRGRSMDFNPTNRSIIFPFEQNGLYGVGEYYLP